MCKTNSTQRDQEVKPLFRRQNDRIDLRHVRVIDPCGAINVLNQCYRAMFGINAISELVRANRIGDEGDEPLFSVNIEGGLLDAVIALSDGVLVQIDFFASRASDKHAELTSAEVRHD